MSTLQKLGMGVIGLAMITTLVLPGRQTPAVVDAFRRLSTGTLSVAMGGPNPA
jgi:hypothetical protein